MQDHASLDQEASDRSRLDRTGEDYMELLEFRAVAVRPVPGRGPAALSGPIVAPLSLEGQPIPTVTVKAHLNGEAAIRLDEAYPLPRHARLLVTLLEPADDMERAAWSALSAEGLASTYADDEPDYAPANLKSPS